MNIKVSNLNTQLKNEDIINLFSPFGSVRSAEIAIDSFTDKPRGFAYVDMENEEEAKKAIAALHQTEQSGQRISVEESAPKTVRNGSYKVGSGAVQAYKFRKQ